MIVALACLLAAIAYLSVVNTRTSTWSYSRLMDQALQGRVKTFEIDGDVGIATDREAGNTPFSCLPTRARWPRPSPPMVWRSPSRILRR